MRNDRPPTSRKQPPRCLRPERRLAASAESRGQGSSRIPRWWVNTVVGLFLLVPAGLLTQTFFRAFSRVTIEHRFWSTEECWFFMLGSMLWMLWFFGSIWASGGPRPLRVYVFGHELTHAIWVWLMGGRVSHFEASRDGGFIVTDTHNFWIALTPYFYPLYSLVVVVLFIVASFFHNVTAETATFLFITPLQWMFLALGATWAFHLSFTGWMIPRGQSDLSYHGTFFSLVVIYVMNLLVIALFLIVAAPEITFVSFGRELFGNVEDFSETTWLALAAVAHRFSAR